MISDENLDPDAAPTRFQIDPERHGARLVRAPVDLNNLVSLGSRVAMTEGAVNTLTQLRPLRAKESDIKWNERAEVAVDPGGLDRGRSGGRRAGQLLVLGSS